MAEYISREITLDAIRELSQRYNDESLAMFAYDIVTKIPNADVQPVNQWISCKDKMPEHGVNVLIYTGNSMISLAWYDKDMEYFYICDSDYKYNPLDVTHWQPLPEPPKEG